METGAETVIFAVSTDDEECTVGLIGEKPARDHDTAIAAAADIMVELGAVTSDSAYGMAALKEVTLDDMRNLLRRAYRGGFIQDDDALLESLGLQTRWRGVSFHKGMIRESDAAAELRKRPGSLYSESLLKSVRGESATAAAALHSRSLRDEMDRIFADAALPREFVGHPVHYLIEAGGG